MDRLLARALLSPRSIAIIGASSDPSKASARPLRYLVEGGFNGAIYPVNAHVGEIAGIPAWRSIDALPETPDIAFILLPATATPAAVAQCGKRGIPAAIVLASGFSEAGKEGAKLENELRQTARDNGIRLVGPNSLGLVNLHEHVVLTGNAAFAERTNRVGGIFCASQSGSMIGSLLSRGTARGIGFAGFVSVGLETDFSLGALCELTLDDPRITSYMLFLETIRDSVGLRRFAIGAAERGKPVVALKLGQSEAAVEIATTHTGALAGDDDVADAFLADCGIARVETLEGLLEAPSLLSQLAPPSGQLPRQPRVGVVTTTGGGAALVVDQLGIRGISVEAPGDEVHAILKKSGIRAAPGRILDLTLDGARYDTMKNALEAMASGSHFDLVIAAVGSSARFQPELTVRPIVEVAESFSHLAAFIVPEAPEALAMLTDAGIPNFRTPESCADAIAAAFRRGTPRNLEFPDANPISIPQSLDEQEGYEILRKIGIPYAEFETTDLRAPVVDPRLYPVALKVLHRDIAHKSDIGGVVLGIESPEALDEAAVSLRANLERAAPGIPVSRLIAQKMVSRAVGEVLIGYRVDPHVGPVVVIAAGGTATEIYQDRSVRMAPVGMDEAHRMISEVRGLAILGGFRNRPQGDIEALARAIVAFSQLALDQTIAEIEINPLLVLPEAEGVVAVDVLARLHGPQASAPLQATSASSG